MASTEAPDISVVLPAHNESLLLEATALAILSELARTGLDAELVIVENGSTDETAQIAEQIHQIHSNVTLCRLSRPDYGEALAAGIATARGQWVATFDVDLFSAAFLREGLELVRNGNADLVLASKRAPGSVDRRPALRRFLTAGFALVLRLTVSIPVRDTHGMKVFRREPITAIVDGCKLRGSLFDVELVVRADQAGLRLQELPVTVEELRPPRTGLLRRTTESLSGALRLRSILRAERRG